MSNEARYKKLLEEFETLPDTERSELMAELARRVALSSHDGSGDADLVVAADRLFTELDRREHDQQNHTSLCFGEI